MPKRTKEVPPPAVTRPVFAEPHEDSPVVVEPKPSRCPVDGNPVKSGERCTTCGTVAK
jgi:hypothetical protein